MKDSEDRPTIPPPPPNPSAAFPWENGVVQRPPAPISLMDAFDRLEKVFDHETKTTRLAIIVVRDLVLEHYQRTNTRLDAQADELREQRDDIAEIREHVGLPSKKPTDGL